MKQVVQSLLGSAGLGVVSDSRLTQLKDFEQDVARVLKLPTAQLVRLVEALPKSRAQIGQDLFVLSALDFKRDGYFVEFGATNGVDLSNTHLLEKELGWTGILAEPATCWHDALRANRACRVDTDCVWRDSQSTLLFKETDTAELSTVAEFTGSDGHRHARAQGRSYPVKTVSLVDLLDRHQAPRVIDYLSIDTEGSELEILKAFDFAKYRFRVITCEHNFGKDREAIQRLLAAHGYARRYTGLSRWDDWFVHSST